MSAFFKSHANQCISGKESTTLTSSASLSSPTVPPTPGLSGLPPVVVGSCLSTRRLKKRPIEGLHLGSLPPSALATSSVPFANDAFNPFFSNIRQNMELCHGSIKERFPVRFPRQSEIDPDTGLVRFLNNNDKRVIRYCAGISSADELHIMLPPWMRKVIDPELGPKNMAESYEVYMLGKRKRVGIINYSVSIFFFRSLKELNRKDFNMSWRITQKFLMI